MNPNYDFTGRIAVVTGGSDGIGLDFCRALTESNCEVFFCGRRADKGEEAAAKLGPRAHFIQADISHGAQIAGFVTQVRQAAGKIDFLVNNVASDDRIAFQDLTEEICDRLWRINLRSYLLTTRAFLDCLRAGTGKSVVNVGTTNYMFGLEPFTLYNATKSGILGFTRSLARELGAEGIRANMLSPGWIMTEKQLREHIQEQDKKDLVRDQALKFLLEPHHVTPALLFLLSDAAFGITGQNLVVDGGKYMQ